MASRVDSIVIMVMSVLYVLLGVILVGVNADHHKIKCSDLQALQDLDVKQFTGKWVGVESLSFKDGHPIDGAPTPIPEHGTVRCVKSKVKGNETHVAMKIKLYMTEGSKISKKTLYTIDPQTKGHLIRILDQTAQHETELKILAAKPDKYMVTARCMKTAPEDEMAIRMINIVSRHMSSFHGAEGRKFVSDESSSEEETTHVHQHHHHRRSADTPTAAPEVTEADLEEARTKLKEILGITHYEPLRLETDCCSGPDKKTHH